MSSPEMLFSWMLLATAFIYACYLNYHRYRQQKAIKKYVKRVPRYRSSYAASMDKN